MITRRLFAIAAAASLTVGASAQAQTPEEFFEGRTIRVISSTGAGGTMDLYLLLFMKYAERHLPSGTTMVLDHRTGGGGAIMANYMYNQANNDGTEIGMPVPALVSSTFSTPDATRYDPSEFGVLGRLVDNPRVFVARAETGFETLEDMANAESETTHGIMTVGASFDQFMRVANESMGTNFRPVAGYSGGGPTFLALEQGEVMSTTAEPANLLANKWHLVEAGDINVLGYLGLEPIPGLEAYPNLLDLIDESNPAYGQTMAVAQSSGLGLSLITPPNVPEDRLAYLRQVFDATMTDPDLIAEAAERRIPLAYSTGDQVQQIIAESLAIDDATRAWFAALNN